MRRIFKFQKYLLGFRLYIIDFKRKYTGLCNSIPYSKNKILFTYLLDINIIKIDYINKLSNLLNAEIKIISADSDIKSSDTIENWISMFRDASYVVTDSYHDTIFSIIFNKDFTTSYNSNRSNSRMDSLMEITGLQYKCIDTDTLNDKLDAINWNIVNANIESKIAESKLYLKRSLKI